MNRSAEERIRQAAEMSRWKCCSKARNAGNSGANGAWGSSQEGETECSIDRLAESTLGRSWMVTRLNSSRPDSLHWCMDLVNRLSTGPESLLDGSDVVQIYHLMHSYFVFIHLRYNWNIIICICSDRYKNKINSESNRDKKMAKLLYGFSKNLSLELLQVGPDLP